MKILSNYFIYLVCSCLIIFTQPSLSKEASSSQPQKKEQVQENSNPGFSYKNPLVVTKMKDDVELLEFQREFMNQWSEDYVIMSRSLAINFQNRLLQIFGVWNDEDERVVMYFDITEVAKKHRKFKDKVFQKEVEKALKKGPFKIKLPPMKQAKKVSWAETSESVREQVFAHVREDIKKGTLSEKLRQEIKKDVPLSDIPEDIRKEIAEDK